MITDGLPGRDAARPDCDLRTGTAAHEGGGIMIISRTPPSCA